MEKDRVIFIKKLFCHFLLVLFICILGISFVSCGDNGDNTVEEMSYFNVSTVTLSAKGEVPYTGSFTIDTNLQWSIIEKPSWVSLDVMEGTGKKNVRVTITSSDKNFRSGNIVVTSSTRQYEKTIRINQNGNTLSAITGEYKGSKVTSGAFLGTDKQVYKYEHKITVEFSINGSHLASSYGVTGSTIQGALSDGVHSTVVTLYSNHASTSFTYRAFATRKSNGDSVYGTEKTIISSQNSNY